MSNGCTFPPALLERIARTRVMAVLVVDQSNDAIPLAQALLAGGIDAMELTLRTPAAIAALRLIKSEVPRMIVGAGTVLTPDQLGQVIDAKADFAVAPGTNPRVVKAAADRGFPFAPGIATPTDIEHALEFGCKLLKFFPAEPAGGLAYLKIIAAPYLHLGLKYIPLGGLDATNTATYLREPIVQAVGGSWIAPRDLISRRDWSAIEKNARSAVNAAGGGKDA